MLDWSFENDLEVLELDLHDFMHRLDTLGTKLDTGSPEQVSKAVTFVEKAFDLLASLLKQDPNMTHHSHYDRSYAVLRRFAIEPLPPIMIFKLIEIMGAVSLSFLDQAGTYRHNTDTPNPLRGLVAYIIEMLNALIAHYPEDGARVACAECSLKPAKAKRSFINAIRLLGFLIWDRYDAVRSTLNRHYDHLFLDSCGLIAKMGKTMDLKLLTALLNMYTNLLTKMHPAACPQPVMFKTVYLLPLLALFKRIFTDIKLSVNVRSLKLYTNLLRLLKTPLMAKTFSHLASFKSIELLKYVADVLFTDFNTLPAYTASGGFVLPSEDSSALSDTFGNLSTDPGKPCLYDQCKETLKNEAALALDSLVHYGSSSVISEVWKLIGETQQKSAQTLFSYLSFSSSISVIFKENLLSLLHTLLKRSGFMFAPLRFKSGSGVSFSDPTPNSRTPSKPDIKSFTSYYDQLNATLDSIMLILLTGSERPPLNTSVTLQKNSPVTPAIWSQVDYYFSNNPSEYAARKNEKKREGCFYLTCKIILCALTSANLGALSNDTKYVLCKFIDQIKLPRPTLNIHSSTLVLDMFEDYPEDLAVLFGIKTFVLANIIRANDERSLSELDDLAEILMLCWWSGTGFTAPRIKPEIFEQTLKTMINSFCSRVLESMPSNKNFLFRFLSQTDLLSFLNHLTIPRLLPALPPSLFRLLAAFLNDPDSKSLPVGSVSKNTQGNHLLSLIDAYYPPLDDSEITGAYFELLSSFAMYFCQNQAVLPRMAMNRFKTYYLGMFDFLFKNASKKHAIRVFTPFSAHLITFMDIPGMTHDLLFIVDLLRVLLRAIETYKKESMLAERLAMLLSFVLNRVLKTIFIQIPRFLTLEPVDGSDINAQKENFAACLQVSDQTVIDKEALLDLKALLTKSNLVEPFHTALFTFFSEDKNNFHAVKILAVLTRIATYGEADIPDQLYTAVVDMAGSGAFKTRWNAFYAISILFFDEDNSDSDLKSTDAYSFVAVSMEKLEGFLQACLSQLYTCKNYKVKSHALHAMMRVLSYAACRHLCVNSGLALQIVDYALHSVQSGFKVSLKSLDHVGTEFIHAVCHNYCFLYENASLLFQEEQHEWGLRLKVLMGDLCDLKTYLDQNTLTPPQCVLASGNMAPVFKYSKFLETLFFSADQLNE